MEPDMAETVKDFREFLGKETKELRIGRGAIHEVGEVFRMSFPEEEAILIADPKTLPFARAVEEELRKEGCGCTGIHVIEDPELYAGHRFVEEVQRVLEGHRAVAVAVGSGTINDLVKLASHRLERPYLCVATAASMDGYTAFGASITFEGSKQTFSCPAPAAVVADTGIMATAPVEMGASGYADLLSKVTAGADWILADALGEEAIDRKAWDIVQGGLRHALADPEGVKAGNLKALEALTEGLMLGGFAMQWHRSSRPASGAEHQFSHLWDMQHHTHNGRAPSHGFKVGVATLAVTALYEALLNLPLEEIDPAAAAEAWPEPDVFAERIRELFPDEELQEIAVKEGLLKHPPRETVRCQVELLRKQWPELRDKLRGQLIPFAEIRHMLEEAGAPTEPEEIGISRNRLRKSFDMAYFIRRRFTVLDLARRACLLEPCLEHLFGPEGIWPENGGRENPNS
jgi:glycerol-1-phosphate dehydrogenase [NAD(P)+]